MRGCELFRTQTACGVGYPALGGIVTASSRGPDPTSDGHPHPHPWRYDTTAFKFNRLVSYAIRQSLYRYRRDHLTIHRCKTNKLRLQHAQTREPRTHLYKESHRGRIIENHPATVVILHVNCGPRGYITNTKTQCSGVAKVFIGDDPIAISQQMGFYS